MKYIEENSELRGQVKEIEKELISERSYALGIRRAANTAAKFFINLITAIGITILIVGGLPLFGYQIGFFSSVLVFVVMVGTGFMTLRGLGIQVLESKVEKFLEKLFEEK